MRRPCRRGAAFAARHMSAPLAGVRLSITRTNLVVTTDADGKFAFESEVPPGKLDLFIDGRNVSNSDGQQYPSLHFEFNAIRGQRNILPHPIYLPPLLMSEAKVVGGNQDVSLKIPSFEGFEMIIKANSVTFPDGAKVGPLVVSPVHLDKLPMVPPSGTATFMAPAWTIQPSGTRFDPPIEVRIPNSINLKPGETREIYQWDHDLATFVPMGRATVNEDASLLVSDAGSGITKAGWGGPPSVPPPDPDCAKTKGPTEDDCGEQCLKLNNIPLGRCPRKLCTTEPNPPLTSEKYGCCYGKKYEKDSQCCLNVAPHPIPNYHVTAERGKPIVDGGYELAGLLIRGSLGSQPTQYEGPPKSNINDPKVKLETIDGVTYAVDGCSVPPNLQGVFPPGLFINKADPATLVNQHPDAEIFYGACQGHDYCYQTCGSKQSDCDSDLKTVLQDFCASIRPELPGFGFYDRISRGKDFPYISSRRNECINNADKAYLGLVIGGAPAHETRQKEMCVACK